MQLPPKLVQIIWVVAVIALLHVSSLSILALWVEGGLSRHGLGPIVSLLILFALPVIVVLWIVRHLGRGFALSPSHWLVPLGLAPVAWLSLNFSDLFED